MTRRLWLEPPEVWEAEIRAYEEADLVLAAASGRRRLHRQLEHPHVDDPGRRHGTARGAQSRLRRLTGASGAVLRPAHRAAGRPRAVGLYAGENDLEARTGKTPEHVLAEVAAFAALLSRQLPRTQLYLISVKPSPARRRRWSLMQRLNTLLAAFAREDPRRAWIDVATPSFDARGRRRCELFLEDGLHLSPAGYVLCGPSRYARS